MPNSPANLIASLRPQLGLAIAGLRMTEGGAEVDATTLREAVDLAQRIGCRAITLNAAAQGLRARDLDRSARRDVFSLLRRAQMAIGGVDLWVPPAHLSDPLHADRARSAAVSAIEMAAELASIAGQRARPALNMMLPTGADQIVAELARAADHYGVRIADHQWPARGTAGGVADAASPIGVGLDPAAVLSAGGDPVTIAARLGATLLSARLSDVSAAGRVEAGSGRLNMTAYAVTLGAVGYSGFVTIDVRQVPMSVQSATRVAAAWSA